MAQPNEAGPWDRALGCLLGLAVGDALGAPVEGAPRDGFPPVTGLRGGGAHGLSPGQWTDDTSQALCLADSLLSQPGFDARDFLGRLVAWWRDGENACTGAAFGFGGTTRAALERFLSTRRIGPADPRAERSSNGALMRLAPVALAHWRAPDAAVAVARAQSAATHPPAVGDLCAGFARLLVEGIAGAEPVVVLAPRRVAAGTAAARRVFGGGWRLKAREEIRSGVDAMDTLEAALWCVGRSGSFSEAVLRAVNLGDDADTVGAVTGQLAGALWGASSIPGPWLDGLAWRDRLEDRARRLFALCDPAG